MNTILYASGYLGRAEMFNEVKFSTDFVIVSVFTQLFIMSFLFFTQC
jgi:hypothetical protein